MNSEFDIGKLKRHVSQVVEKTSDAPVGMNAVKIEGSITEIAYYNDNDIRFVLSCIYKGPREHVCHQVAVAVVIWYPVSEKQRKQLVPGTRVAVGGHLHNEKNLVFIRARAVEIREGKNVYRSISK